MTEKYLPVKKEANAKKRLQLILESTSEGWWEWNLISNQTYHSPGWYRMLGYREDEFPSSVNTWLDLIHPDDREQVFARQQTYMAYNETWELEFRMHTRANEYRWVVSRGKVVKRRKNGNPVLIVGIHIDITSKKQLEQIYQENQLKAELIQGIVRVSISSLNIYDFIGKRIIYSAGKVYRQLGYTEEEFLTLSANFFDALLHPDDQKKVQEHIEELSNTTVNEVLECTFRFRNKNGSYHTILVRDSVYQRNPSGQIVQVIGSAIDMTEYLFLKGKLEEKIKFLEELTVKNSHAVRGPVATILGLVHVMKNEPNPTAWLELIDYLDRTVTKLDKIIIEFGDIIAKQSRKTSL